MAPLLLALLSTCAAVPTDGLLVRLDASDAASLTLEAGMASAWTSIAGSGASFVATGDRRPAYLPREGSGLPPVVRFDGVDDVLTWTGAGLRAGTWTLAVVLGPLSNKGGEGCLLSACPAGGNDYDPGLTVDMRYSRAAFEELNVEGAGRVGATMDLLCRDYPFGPMRLVVVERDRTEVRVTVDGQRELTRPVTEATTIADEVRLGARHYGGSERGYLHANVSRVLLYNRVLGTEEMRQLVADLTPSPELRLHEEENALSETRGTTRSAPARVVREWRSATEFAASRPAGSPALETLPILTDLREAIGLGMTCLNRSFDRDRDGEPFFYANRREDGTGEMHHSVNIGIPHVVGRALWATMLGELSTGIPFPAEGLETLERYLRSSYANEDHLNSYYDPARGGSRHIEFHNMREGLYGLVALIEGRDSAWARAEAHRMLETLDAITDESGHWSQALIAGRGMSDRCEGVGPPNASRMVDPLLRYYRLTKDDLGLKLAAAYARAAMPELCFPDGRFRPMEHSTGHIHTITSSLSGITEYAILVGDTELLAWCRRALDVGVPEFFSSWGWGDEVVPEHPANEPSRGEINQTGDVVRMALLLGDAGYPEYYEIAERYTRGMLLPTQHRAGEMASYLRNVEDPKDDSEREVLERAVGGYAMQLPNDRMRAGDWPLSTLDITSGAVHALCEVWRHRCVVEGETLRVAMLFGYDGPELTLTSGLPTDGRLTFTMHRAGSLALRLPPWVDASTLRVQADGAGRPAAVEAGFVTIAGLTAGASGEVTFDVPCREEQETVDGVTHTTTWIGDQVIEILPRGGVSPLPW